LKGNISKLTFVTFEDKWSSEDEEIESSFAPVGAVSSFVIDGNRYYGRGSLNSNTFHGYYCKELGEYYSEGFSVNTLYKPIIVLPSYKYDGFNGSAFHSNKDHTEYVVLDENTGSGTILSRRGLMNLVDAGKIEEGIDLNVQLSNPVS